MTTTTPSPARLQDYRISRDSQLNATVQSLIRRLRQSPVLTLTALSSAVEKLTDVLSHLLNKRLIRLKSLSTFSTTTGYLEDKKEEKDKKDVKELNEQERRRKVA